MESPKYKFIFISLFNDLIKPFLNHSVFKKPIKERIIKFEFFNLRDFSDLKNSQIDDYQSGPGAGMVLMTPPIWRAIQEAKHKLEPKRTTVLLLTPQGRPWNQKLAQQFINNYQNFIFISGNYEGFDERIRSFVDHEISIGDYVLTSGELPTLVIVNSLMRLIPGTIKKDSRENDSFTNGRLDYPVYTRPKEFLKMSIPEVLVSGNHQIIKNWRIKQSLLKTLHCRPDLFQANPLTSEEMKILKNDQILFEQFKKIINQKPKD